MRCRKFGADIKSSCSAVKESVTVKSCVGVGRLASTWVQPYSVQIVRCLDYLASWGGLGESPILVDRGRFGLHWDICLGIDRHRGGDLGVGGSFVCLQMGHLACNCPRRPPLIWLGRNLSMVRLADVVSIKCSLQPQNLTRWFRVVNTYPGRPTVVDIVYVKTAFIITLLEDEWRCR